MIMENWRLADTLISCDNATTIPSGATHMFDVTCANAPTLEAKVHFLSSPSSYSHRPDHVIAKETHMSWVFLAGERVFKLKKPVRYSYLDFTTLEARERYCREETRLNRRLAPGVYRGVVPLTCSSTGVMALGGGGGIVDWLVEMQRLPADCMLDVRLKEGRVGKEDIRRLAQVLANFYRRAERPAIDPDMPFRHFTHELAQNRAVLLCPDLWPDQSRASVLLDQLEAALTRIRPRLRERAQSGCIVDGHGDLRPEHVCLTDPIVIFDCLEFNRDLRLVDPYDELTFLGMECAHLNAAWFGGALIERVSEIIGDVIPHDLLDTYTALHAVLRARLSLAHLLDPVPREPQKWAPQARQYLDLGERALASPL